MKLPFILATLAIALLAIFGMFIAWQSWFPADPEPIHSEVLPEVLPLTEEEKEAGVDAMIVWICPVGVYEEMRERSATGEYTAEERFKAMGRNCESRNYIVQCPSCDVFVQANTGAEEIMLSDNLTESGTSITKGQYEGRDSYFIVQVFAGPEAGMQ